MQFSEVIKLRIRRRGNYPGLSGSASSDHNNPYTRRQEELALEEEMWGQKQRKKRCALGGRKGCRPRGVGGHSKLEMSRKQILSSERPE